MNKCMVIGRLTKDIDLRYTTEGKAVANFTLAIDRPFKTKTGEKEADFIPIVVWGKIADNCGKYLGKGSKISVSGRIQTRNYEDKNHIKRYVTEIVAEEVEFLDRRNNRSEEPEEIPGDMQYEMENLSGLEEFLKDDDSVPF